MLDAVTRFLRNIDPMLTRLDDQLALAESPHEAAATLCEFTGRELNLADCVIYLPDGESALVQTAAWGTRRSMKEATAEGAMHQAMDRGVVGDCARQLHKRCVADARQDPRYAFNADAPISELAVPLHHEDVLLAVLDSGDPTPGFYDLRYQQVFEAIADCGTRHLWRLRAPVT